MTDHSHLNGRLGSSIKTMAVMPMAPEESIWSHNRLADTSNHARLNSLLTRGLSPGPDRSSPAGGLAPCRWGGNTPLPGAVARSRSSRYPAPGVTGAARTSRLIDWANHIPALGRRAGARGARIKIKTRPATRRRAAPASSRRVAASASVGKTRSPPRVRSHRRRN